jgi:hypothetical protein
MGGMAEAGCLICYGGVPLRSPALPLRRDTLGGELHMVECLYMIRIPDGGGLRTRFGRMMHSGCGNFCLRQDVLPVREISDNQRVCQWMNQGDV